MNASFTVSTKEKVHFIDITSQVQKAVGEAGIKDGAVIVFVPHTTAGITINENADPSVRRDILHQLDKMVPQSGDYHHSEGNSPGHIKASLVGSSVTVLISDGRLALGTWQGIYFCEFDGPRNRKVWVKTLGS